MSITPGPWKLSQFGVPEIYATKPGFNLIKICTLPMVAGQPANPSDAAAIEALPALLAALERFVTSPRGACVGNAGGDCFHAGRKVGEIGNAMCVACEARAALRLARGEV